MSRLPALQAALEQARHGRLYPSGILHGGAEEARREAATELARTLLCDSAPETRPCGVCRHCRRIDSARGGERFHPDFALLERDLKTATSVEATRNFLRVAHYSPFEARGQVFVVAEADSLSPEAGDALLKLLEEPGLGAPRHFFLLAPSALDLPATLRSRSLATYLGAAAPAPEEAVAALARGLATSFAGWASARNPLFLLDAAGRLFRAGKFDDPRSELPWTLAATAMRRAAFAPELPAPLRRPLLDLALDLLSEAPSLRLRGIGGERILEGLICQRLAR